MNKRVVITLGKNGSRKVEAFGFKGGECKDKTQFLSKIFGEIKEETLKPSFYEVSESESLLDTDGLPGGGEYCG